VITVKWAVFDGFARTGSGYAGVLAGAPFFNLFFLTAILLAGAIMVSRSAREVGRAFAGWWITAVGFIALNVETLRAVDCFVGMGGAGPVYGVDPWIVKCVALSIVWGMVGLVLVLVGLLKNAAPIRWVGLILLGVTVAKVLLVDTASAQMMLRVLSFMVVGAVLLLVSFAYHKVSVLPRGEPVTGAAGAGVPK